MSTREPWFLCVHAHMVSGKVHQCPPQESFTRRGPWGQLDDTTLSKPILIGLHSWWLLDCISPVPGMDHAQHHGWSQDFGFEFQFGSSASGCDAQQRDNHNIPKRSVLSPQANIQPSLHTDPSTRINQAAQRKFRAITSPWGSSAAHLSAEPTALGWARSSLSLGGKQEHPNFSAGGFSFHSFLHSTERLNDAFCESRQKAEMLLKQQK